MSDKIKITQIIPNPQEIEAYEQIAKQNSYGFEYNDFYYPDLLDDASALKQRIAMYKNRKRPAQTDTMHGAFYDIVPFSWDRRICEVSRYRMQQSVEIAGELGCRAVIFHTGLMPGLVGDEKYRTHWLCEMADTMRVLLKQDSSMEIYCENMFDQSPHELAELAKLLEEEKRFGICLDIGHMMLAASKPEEWFSALGSFIRHFHINDNHLQRDDHLALGSGRIDWKQVFDLMRKYGLCDRSILLEVRGLDKISSSLEYLGKLGEE